MNNSAERLFEAYKEDFGTSKPESLPAIGDKIADVIELERTDTQVPEPTPQKPTNVVLLDAYREQMSEKPKRKILVAKSGRKIIGATGDVPSSDDIRVIRNNLNGAMPKAKYNEKPAEVTESASLKEADDIHIKPKYPKTTIGALLAEIDQQDKQERPMLLDDFAVPEPVQFPKEIDKKDKLSIDSENNSNVSEFSMTWSDGTVNETENAPKNVKTDLDGVEKIANEPPHEDKTDEESESAGVESTGGELNVVRPILLDLSNAEPGSSLFDNVAPRSIGTMVAETGKRTRENRTLENRERSGDTNASMGGLVTAGRRNRRWRRNPITFWIDHTKNKVRTRIDRAKNKWKNKKRGF